ncbi:hypothetical protein ZIOFF_037525 [Zingiber officinale]|uniref:Glycoprotease 1 n=1 Tax=Zingiber officinale TaxID=94328 RepID=A0A8J5GS97_ZINOF|nr:hypothetical protein ZIOFF_037525 [Zingiber officinale]
MASFVFVSAPRLVSRFSFILKPSLPVLCIRHSASPFREWWQTSKPSVRLSNKDSTRMFSTVPSAPPFAARKSSRLGSARDDVVMLGIETSCDDTAAAVADLLSRYGGVAPKMAEEAHSLVIDQVVRQALDNANLTENDLSAVAVTIGPVGVQKARRIAGQFSLPIVGVHHMEAHALVARLIEKNLQFPFLALLISGGHNLLILAHELGHYLQLGTTIDDAIGEAYDKTARWLGLDMRKGGGPALEELAMEGDPNSINFSVGQFLGTCLFSQIPMKQHKDCNFSYAGLKTQVRLAMESRKISPGSDPISLTNSEGRRSRADIAASFQRVAVLHLEERCQRAIEWALKIEPSIKYLVVSGGVASNKYVRARLNHVVENNNLQLVCPPPSLCTDNGVMIAWTGIEHFLSGRFDPPPPDNEPEDAMVKNTLHPDWWSTAIISTNSLETKKLKA